MYPRTCNFAHYGTANVRVDRCLSASSPAVDRPFELLPSRLFLLRHTASTPKCIPVQPVLVFAPPVAQYGLPRLTARPNPAASERPRNAGFDTHGMLATIRCRRIRRKAGAP